MVASNEQEGPRPAIEDLLRAICGQNADRIIKGLHLLYDALTVDCLKLSETELASLDAAERQDEMPGIDDMACFLVNLAVFHMDLLDCTRLHRTDKPKWELRLLDP